ncbi:DUF4355 domain-containing protein [Enterococcus malodoratus]|uniref:capsid assembly scaffolding protein Gp46 family protein n=1 Tax=Enterococcus malodoratus TaxID=71451 RepID=UPI0039AEA3A2
MSEFKPINTQQEFDDMIRDRLDRQKESFKKDLAELEELRTRNSELETEVGTLQSTIEKTKESASQYDQTISELNAKVTSYETANLRTRIAIQNGLPLDLADRLVGEDEDSLKADAERLSGFVKSQKPVPPLRDPEPQLGDEKDNAYKKLIEGLNKEGE